MTGAAAPCTPTFTTAHGGSVCSTRLQGVHHTEFDQGARKRIPKDH